MSSSKKEFETILIVHFAFFGVRQDLVGLRYFFELLRGVWVVFVLVRMVFQCGFPVSCEYSTSGRGELAYRYAFLISSWVALG